MGCSVPKSWFITLNKYLQVFAKTYKTDFKLSFSPVCRCQMPAKFCSVQYPTLPQHAV